MSKLLKLHIILFLLAFGTANALQKHSQEVYEDYEYLEAIDSVTTDNANVLPKQFDNLSEKYTGDDFIYQRSKASSGWWTRFKKAVSDFLKSLFNIQNAGQASRATDIALKIAGVIIFLLVIYFIFKAIVNKEGTWVFGKSSDKKIIPVTDLENNIHQTNFKALISEAESNNNYRLAIRYYYLWLLKGLSEKEIIDYDPEKTNSDYQYEIKTPEISEQFAYTSYLYNYIWYGEFNVDQTQFDKAKRAFTNFLNSVKA
ncbi:DUF4129 domain-containing protein [Mesoflavibacter sp. CH_XMU1422-2]|uniref:DUF4129 domain-containing protein n=1 Tax=Mesoflavibacter sp. CH_XMU1422-2 TaxID=3107770 RepID=UPI00300B12F3|nr:DUF4129 domain-containing protein [Mesoflavibacter sp.]